MTDNSVNNPTLQQQPKIKLYDVPVSNNGARCRIIIYKKNLNEEIQIVSPAELGGLQSAEFLQVNPHAKLPAIECCDGTELKLAESDTIARYLMSRYDSIEPSFQPHLALSNYICRIHDIYMSPLQSSMYKANPPFGQYGTRKDALKDYIRQMNIIESMISGNSLYLCGIEISLADATLFPSLVFATHMLPKFDYEQAIPPKLMKWFENLRQNDDVFQKIYQEIQDALNQWDERGRWDTIFGAGLRDIESQTIFGKLLFAPFILAHDIFCC